MTVTYRLARALLRPMMRLCFGLRTSGQEHVPRTGGLLVVANHTSYLDPPVLSCVAPRELRFLARASLFRFPVFGWLIRSLQAIPLERGASDRKALRLARDALRGGAVLAIFPEGTRSSDGRLGRAMPGVGLLALQADVPIIAAHIEGAFQAMPRSARFPRLRRIQVTWGEARTPEDWAARGPEGEKPARRIVQALMEEIARLGGHDLPDTQNGWPDSPVIRGEESEPPPHAEQ